MLKIIRKLSVTDDKSLQRLQKQAKTQKSKVEIKHTTQRGNHTHYIVEVISYSNIKYEALVSLLIRKKYSIDEELAILRQKSTKIIEFEEYNSFAEQCKVKAKEMIQEREDFWRSLEV